MWKGEGTWCHHFAQCSASQNAETPRFAAKRGLIRKAAKGEAERAHLKSTSQKSKGLRGWDIYGITNKEAGPAKAWGAWGKGLEKSAVIMALLRCN